MAKCLTLPTEIWLRIIGYLRPEPYLLNRDEDIDDFNTRVIIQANDCREFRQRVVALAQTCRLLQSVALPVLYRAPLLKSEPRFDGRLVNIRIARDAPFQVKKLSIRTLDSRGLSSCENGFGAAVYDLLNEAVNLGHLWLEDDATHLFDTCYSNAKSNAAHED